MKKSKLKEIIKSYIRESIEDEPLYVEYVRDITDEEPFVIGGKKYEYVMAKYPDGKVDIGVYAFAGDLVYSYNAFRNMTGIKEGLKIGMSNLKVGEVVVLKKDVVNISGLYTMSLKAGDRVIVKGLLPLHRLEVLPEKMKAVYLKIGFGKLPVVYDDEVQSVESGKFSHSPQMRVRSDEPQFDETGEYSIKESGFNILQKEKLTKHDLDKTPNKSVSSLTPVSSVRKLTEMSISRVVNADDKASGVTGYTSHSIKCRGCDKDCNTLRKDSVGNEGVYCCKDCANNIIDESENFSEGLWDRLKADAAGSFKMGGSSLDAQIVSRFNTLKRRVETDDKSDYSDFMNDVQKILGTKNIQDTKTRLQGYTDIVNYLKKFEPPIISTQQMPTTVNKNGVSVKPKQKTQSAPETSVAGNLPKDDRAIVINSKDLPAFNKRNIKMNVNQVFRFNNKSWYRRDLNVDEKPMAEKPIYVPLKASNNIDAEIIDILNSSIKSGRDDTNLFNKIFKRVSRDTKKSPETKTNVTSKTPKTNQLDKKNDHRWVKNLGEYTKSIRAIDVDQVPLIPIEDESVDCEVGFDYDLPIRTTRIDPGQGWSIYVNTVIRKDTGAIIDFDKLDTSSQKYIEDACVDYLEYLKSN